MDDKDKKILEKVMKKLEGRELFPESNARAREFLKNIKSLPDELIKKESKKDI